MGVSVSGADSKRIYAIIEAKDGGLFLSDDGGETWKLVNDDRRLRQRAFYYTRIYADPKAKDTRVRPQYRDLSLDRRGKTIKPIRVPHGDNHDLWIASNDPKRMINSNDGGANVSVNAGESWTDQDFPTAQLYNVFTTAHVPYHVCGAQQDNSTVCVPSNGQGTRSTPSAEVRAATSRRIPWTSTSSTPAATAALLTRLNRRTGDVRAVNVWPDNPMGHNSGDMAERFQWTYPIVIAPTDPHTLYATSQHVWKSINEGQSWERISPDLTRHDPSTMGDSGGPITLDQTGVETYATVFALAPSTVDGKVLWAGSDDGLVNVTRDGGKTWDNVTPPDLPEFARVSLIDASPHDVATAYVAANRYQRSDRAPYVYRTHDFGKTWTKITDGVRADDFARAIKEDPQRKGLIWLGTETGIYVSFDDGDHWQTFNLDLPVTPVHGITVKNDDLVIGTHGRSFYVLDNINVLRQADRTTTTQPVVLFKPAEAMRSVSRGVAIDYFLKQPADAVSIEILDAHGQLIRTFKGVPTPAKAEGETETPPSDEDSFRPPPPRVATKEGLNRFVWDMRYPDATDFKGLVLWAGSIRGPVAPPGSYQVRLDAAGQVKTEAFTIVRNPLGRASDADLQEQFTLARQISARVSAANDAVLRIRELKEQVAARSGKTTDVHITKAAGALTRQLTDVEGEIYQYRNRSSQDPLNFPIRLNNKLAALQGIVDSGDAKPTEQSYAVFKDLSAQLDRQLERLTSLMKTEVPAFNKELARKRLAPVTSGDARP